MSLGQREKHSIAWFVLAEFVKRGEKERALAMYRLLMHNIDNPAFSSHVEGDLLASFQDPNAVDRYKQAALLYTQRGQFDAACSAYERLLQYAPHNAEYAQLLVQSYNRLGNWLRCKMFLHEMLLSLRRHGHTEIALNIIAITKTSLQTPQRESILDTLESLMHTASTYREHA